MNETVSLEPFIAGNRRAPASQREVVLTNPANNTETARFAAAGPEAVDAAVTSARSAFEGAWGGMPPAARAGVLKAFATQIEANAERLAACDCLDIGKPVSAGRFEAAIVAAGFVRYYAEAIDKWQRGIVAPTDAGAFEAQVRRPRGVIATIIPWNFPVINLAMKIAPMLAAGNAVVAKPSELSPRSASLIAELAMAAGLPPGALNIVPGDGQTGDVLARHAGIDMLAFTGSTATGKALMRAIGESNLKPALLECGGKSPEIVFGDMANQNLDAMAAQILGGAMVNQGQVCVMRSRLYIEDAIYEPLLERIVDQARAIRPGDPADPACQFGPLASKRQQSLVEGFVGAAESEGTKLLLDGRGALAGSGGCYVGPTIFEATTTDSSIMQNEVFGPVIAVQRFSGEDEAIRLANGTSYGLAATIWTSDLGRAHRVSDRIDAGMTKVMAAPVRRMGAGFAHSAEACKQSGFGIEGGLGALESFSRLHAVEFHYGDAP
jgi:gamma-glutamyl-gamma-aminobutyraldehyde dehydrogenase